MPKRIQFEDLKKAKLGLTFEKHDLANSYCCKGVYGAVAFPGKRPGYAVVVAMDPAERFGSHDVCLLAEFESFRMRDLVRQCGALDFKYSPKSWIGDWKNDAGSRFIQEMNFEQEKQRRQFSLTSTPMLEMEHLYQYALDELKRLLDKDRRQLFLKTSKILNYLSEIEESETAALELGDYPAIEAIAFAVIEMRNYFAENFDYSEDYCDDAYAGYHPLHKRRQRWF